MDDVVRRVLAQATAVAATEDSDSRVRRRMARLVRSLSDHVGPSEELCAEAVRAASARLDDHCAVRELLDAAAALAPDESRLVEPVRRLCARAHAAGLRPTVLVCLLRLVRTAGFDGRVPDEWLEGVADVRQQVRLQLVALLWVRRFGARHPGVRGLIRAHEDWLLSETLPEDMLREMHQRQPTISGWRALAARCGPIAGPLRMSFGDGHSEAIETLRDAADGAVDDHARRVLAQWLTELAS